VAAECPAAVFGSELMALLSTMTRVRTMRARPASRSTSSQRRPHTSPRRGPRASSNHQAARSLSPATTDGNRPASSADQAPSPMLKGGVQMGRILSCPSVRPVGAYERPANPILPTLVGAVLRLAERRNCRSSCPEAIAPASVDRYGVGDRALWNMGHARNTGPGPWLGRQTGTISIRCSIPARSFPLRV
jgi:hypothetical protein